MCNLSMIKTSNLFCLYFSDSNKNKYIYMYIVNIHRASSEVNTSYTIILTLVCEQALRSERIPGDMKRRQGKSVPAQIS